MFLTFCENYGVPKTNLCQTVDLYEGTNMPQFLSCVQCLGTEVSMPICRRLFCSDSDSAISATTEHLLI